MYICIYVGLKVWPVTEIVTYGFNPDDAPLDMGGIHLTPQQFHDTMAEENTVVVDVRNFNETAIGRFQPPGGVLSMNSKVYLNIYIYIHTGHLDA